MILAQISTRLILSSLPAMLTVGLIIISVGCAIRARDMITYHAFDYPSPARETEPPIPGTLMVYRFLTAPSVDVDSLNLSQSRGTEKAASLSRWADNPADMLTELLLRDFETSGLFEKTVDQLSSVSYRYALEGTIRNIQGIITDGKGKALVDVEVTMTDFEAPIGKGKNLIRKLYKIEIPSSDATPDSIVKALNLAMQELSVRLRKDIRSAIETNVPAEGKKSPHKAPRSNPRPRTAAATPSWP